RRDDRAKPNSKHAHQRPLLNPLAHAWAAAVKVSQARRIGMRYEAIPVFGEGDVERVLARGDLGELRLLALSFALDCENREQSEALCLRLSNHEDGVVRGNAILGLGHVARIHGTLTERVA